MATIGQALTSPEAGWQRIDLKTPVIESGWTIGSGASNYNSDYFSSTTSTNKLLFKFKGTMLRMIAMKWSGGASLNISIDGVTETYSLNNATQINLALVYEKLGLSNTIHTVQIWKTDTLNTGLVDAIDIDSTGYLVHPLLNQVSNIKDMQIGDVIPCRYKATTSGAIGTFSELGTCTATEIPVASSATPDGLFYFVHAGYDTRGRMKLIADRNIQSNITWDTLNTNGYTSGEGWVNNNFISEFIDGNGANGMNYDVTKNVDRVEGVVFRNETYVSWSENNGTANQLRVRKWNGSSWVSVDGGVGLNYNVTRSANTAKLITVNDTLYLIWIETNGTANQLRAKKYDGTTWAWVDGGGTTSLINYDTTKSANTTSCVVYNNELYVAWYEDNGTANQERVKKFNGTTWTFIDGGGANGINYDATKNGSASNIKVYNNELYVAWYEPNASSVNQIRIKKWNGTSWSWVDGGGANGINYSASYGASIPRMEVLNNELYCAWYENNTSAVYQIRVKKYNGSTWTWIDGGGANGLNYNTAYNAQAVFPFVFNNELYCAWQEANASTINQLRIKKWNGTSWSWVDGGGANGLNFNVTYGMLYPILIKMSDYKVGLMWQEANASGIYQARMKQFTFSQKIDGMIMNYRLLTGGTSSTDTDNEWDKIIASSNLNSKITAGDDNIWHWSGVLSWTSTTIATSVGANTNKVERGNSSSSAWTYSATTTTACFRPVLIVETIDLFLKFLRDSKGIYSIKNDFTNLGYTLTEQQINDYGAKDLSLLTSPMTKNSETFKPIDKLENNFDVLIYVR